VGCTVGFETVYVDVICRLARGDWIHWRYWSTWNGYYREE